MIFIYFLFLFFLLSFLLKKRLIVIKKLNYLSIFDGLFFGGLFFIIIPMYYSLIIGEIKIVGLKSFFPTEDLNVVFYTTISISFFGLCAVLFSPKKNDKSIDISELEKIFFMLTLLFYFFSVVVFFLSSGKLDGGTHWYRANEGVFQKGPIFVLLGQLHNVSRIIIPAMCLRFQLVYLKAGKIFKAHFIIAIVVIVFELFLAGNRIVILFFVFSIGLPFLIYRNYKVLFSLGILALPLGVIAKFWPMVRGMLWSSEFSLDHLAYVISTAYKYEILENTETDPVMVLTEGSNIAALKFVVNNFPAKYDFLYGDTMFFKALGTLIPKSIWTTKPDGIGILVGETAISGVSLILNITILGDAWGNFGMFGIVYIVIMVYIIQKFFKEKYKVLFSSIFFMTSIACWRFDFSFYFVTIYILIFYIILIRIPFIKLLLKRVSSLIF